MAAVHHSVGTRLSELPCVPVQFKPYRVILQGDATCEHIQDKPMLMVALSVARFSILPSQSGHRQRTDQPGKRPDINPMSIGETG